MSARLRSGRSGTLPTLRLSSRDTDRETGRPGHHPARRVSPLGRPPKAGGRPSYEPRERMRVSHFPGHHPARRVSPRGAGHAPASATRSALAASHRREDCPAQPSSSAPATRRPPPRQTAPGHGRRSARAPLGAGPRPWLSATATLSAYAYAARPAALCPQDTAREADRCAS